MKATKAINAWFKPCPFCDSYPDQKAIIFEYSRPGPRGGKNEVAIVCSNCGIRGPMKSISSTHEVPEIEAIQWWNQRGTILSQEEGDKIIEELDKNWEKGHHHDYYMDDGGTAEVVESELQHIWLRVGMVFNGDKGEDKEDGIWIETQPIYMRSSMDHTMLLSKSTWDKLNKFVQKQFKKAKR
jgi:hypothetical protein